MAIIGPAEIGKRVGQWFVNKILNAALNKTGDTGKAGAVDKPNKSGRRCLDKYEKGDGKTPEKGDGKIMVPKVPNCDSTNASGNVLVAPIDSKNISSGTGTNYGGANAARPNHTGIDIDVPMGTEISAAGDGKVIKVGNDANGYGQYVVIEHGDGVHTLYAHCSTINVEEGQEVKQGEKIGEVGNTGSVRAGPGGDGSHLHFEIRENAKEGVPLSGTPVDPAYLFS